MDSKLRFVLASRSPRRRELLGLLVPPDRIDVVPPASSEELDFAGLSTLPELHERLLRIASHKADQVTRQIGDRSAQSVIIAADTTVIVSDPATGHPVSLGQPPETVDWSATVRDWFERYYAGRWHVVSTGLEIRVPDQSPRHAVVETRVEFRPDVQRWLDWYLQTGESLGKAGGYALQGAGSVFVARIEGSLTNVVGLPLESLAELLGVAPLG